MYRLHIQIVAIKGVDMLLFEESFYNAKKEVVYSQASSFIAQLVKDGWKISKQVVNFTNLSN